MNFVIRENKITSFEDIAFTATEMLNALDDCEDLYASLKCGLNESDYAQFDINFMSAKKSVASAIAHCLEIQIIFDKQE